MGSPDERTSLLCGQCQIWDDPDVVHAPFGPLSSEPLVYTMTPEQMSSNKRFCLLCQAVWDSLQARYHHEEDQSSFQSDSVLRIWGPFYFRDYPLSSPFNLHPKSLKDEEPIISLIIKVEVTKAGESELYITPQFKFHYTRKSKPHLHRLERWTMESFDIALLQRWISRCDNVHQNCKESWTTEGNPLRGLFGIGVLTSIRCKKHRCRVTAWVSRH